MTTTRRDFLAQVACAFAVAGVGCKVPRYVVDTTTARKPHLTFNGIPVFFDANKIYWMGPAGMIVFPS